MSKPSIPIFRKDTNKKQFFKKICFWWKNKDSHDPGTWYLGVDNWIIWFVRHCMSGRCVKRKISSMIIYNWKSKWRFLQISEVRFIGQYMICGLAFRNFNPWSLIVEHRLVFCQKFKINRFFELQDLSNELSRYIRLIHDQVHASSDERQDDVCMVSWF